MENTDISPEIDSGSHAPRRSRRFLTFGLKKIVFPEREIREYFSFNIARQACLQMLFNNWVQGIGFASYISKKDSHFYSEIVHENDQFHKWKLTDDHIALSKYARMDGKWDKAENEEWVSIQSKSISRANENKMENRLNILEDTFKDHFQRNYLMAQFF